MLLKINYMESLNNIIFTHKPHFSALFYIACISVYHTLFFFFSFLFIKDHSFIIIIKHTYIYIYIIIKVDGHNFRLVIFVAI
jgi:hypothetical protein